MIINPRCQQSNYLCHDNVHRMCLLIMKYLYIVMLVNVINVNIDYGAILLPPFMLFNLSQHAT